MNSPLWNDAMPELLTVMTTRAYAGRNGLIQ